MQLVYHGEVLDGFHLADVKRGVAALFKADEAKLALLFGGSRVVVKRSVTRPEAQRYVDTLAQVGARLHIVDDAPAVVGAAPPPSALPLPPTPSPPPLAQPLVPQEEIVCPNCGERQSKRILCRACATDMPMGIAAKLDDEREARALRQAERDQRLGRTRPGEWTGSRDAAMLLGVGFSGRLGRLKYAASGALTWAAFVVLILFALRHPTSSRLAAVALGSFAALFVSVRTSVLRLHDCNRSGWLAVLLMVPYVNVVASLLLTVVPGTRGENDHGAPPRTGSWILVLASLAVLLCTIGFSASQIKALAQNGFFTEDDETAPGRGAGPAVSLSSAEATAAFNGEYAAAPGHKAFATSPSGAWGWQGGATSQQNALESALIRCEARRKPYTPQCEPIDVDGR